MAIDNLKVWCQEVVPDGITDAEQRRGLLDEEYLNGWLRQQTVSYQQLNQILFLLTSYSSPNVYTVHYVDDTAPTSAYEIEADGGSFSQVEAPLLYELYSGTMPDFTSTTPTGMRPVMRKQ